VCDDDNDDDDDDADAVTEAVPGISQLAVTSTVMLV